MPQQVVALNATTIQALNWLKQMYIADRRKKNAWNKRKQALARPFVRGYGAAATGVRGVRAGVAGGVRGVRQGAGMFASGARAGYGAAATGVKRGAAAVGTALNPVRPNRVNRAQAAANARFKNLRSNSTGTKLKAYFRLGRKYW